MGGAASRFGDTDWDKADGGLKEASATFDGSNPTEAHSIFYLRGKSLVSQRDFEVKDEENGLIYATKAIEGTTKDFDVLDKDDNRLFHVHTNASRSKWQIYSYKSNFEGQTPITDRGDVKLQEPLYRKAEVSITWDKFHGVISLYEGTTPEDAQGALSKEHILRIEEIKSITAQFQSFVPKMSLLHPQLCGYWVREHTAKTDRIKMHLAKGTDVALHAILCVITNSVRVERQAENCQ
jgi:hypothetical protein